MQMKKILCATLAALLLASCNDDKDDDACKTECVGNVAYSCENGVQKTTDCGAGGCVGGACVAAVVCTAGEMQCSSKGIPQKCTNNAWVDQKPCGTNQTCKGAGVCESTSANVCTENAMQCSTAGVPQKCVGNKWIDQTPCGTNKTCKGAGICEDSSTKVCTENAMQCSTAGVPQKCIGNAWIDQTPCGTNKTCKGAGICEDSSTNTKTTCGPDDEAICQLRTDGHIWATYCTNGDVAPDEFNKDCTALGLPCSVIPKSDSLGPNDDVDCICQKDAECGGSTPYCVNSVCVECKTNAHCSAKPDTSCKSGICSPNIVSQPDCSAKENGDICQTDSSGNSWRVVCVDNTVIYDDGYGYHITLNCTESGKSCVQEDADNASCQ